MLIALSWLYMAYGNVPAVAGVLYGIKPAVVAIVLHAAWRIGSRTLQASRAVGRSRRWRSSRSSRSTCRFPPSSSRRACWARSAAASLPPRSAWARALGDATARIRRRCIDDDTPTPAHARFSRGSPRASSSIVFVRYGRSRSARWRPRSAWTSTLAQMGWFFTKAALLTFGGAYAVLPYVYQGAVESVRLADAGADDRRPGAGRNDARSAHHGRRVRRLRRRVDATALLGAGRAVRSRASPARCVATFFTFLPSFLFILAGGPLIETTHGQHRASRRR